MKVPEERFLVGYWAASRAADNLWSVHWLFNRTGEPWLLELAEKIQRRTANWTGTIPNWHNVNLAQGFGGPTFFWPQSKEAKHLAASERNWQTIRDQYGHVPGGMFGGDENCRPGYEDPRQAVETCGMVEMMFSHERLFLVTGNPIWADRCEDVAFNSLPAGQRADFKGLRYLTAPNLILSDRHNKAPGYQNGGAMLLFDPYSHRCCQHNFGHGWPYFAEHLWTATPGNGLAAALYAPSRVRAKVGDGTEIVIAETTHYPFEERIEFTLTAPRAVTFPLYLRIPAWCANPEVRINGAFEPIEARPLSFIRLERQWNNGDAVRLDLPMEVALRTWTRNHGSVSVDRGPLTYSLKIGERYVRQGGTEKWPAWEIHPTTPWNYGLVLDPIRPASSFRLVKTAWPDSEMPFTHAGVPIALTAKGRRIPEWQADHLGLVGLLQDSPVRSSQPEEQITLIPMGAARLRIASFPVIGDGPEARAWKSPPPSRPYKATASHVNESDTVFALKDDVVPKHSNDQEIPRFTWWDHKGTTEWVQYEFDAEQQVFGVEVYWFDDTPGGGCGVPASWRVLHQAGDDWKPVSNPQAGPVAKDRFNVMTFEPVRTRALRIEVQLKPGLSGGILEWRVKSEG